MATLHATDAPAVQAKFAAATQPNERYDRFIVTYKDGTSERKQRGAALQTFKAAISRAGLNRSTRSAAGPLTPSHQGKLAVGADVFRTSRKLSQNEANQLMMQLGADPAVAYVEPDLRIYAIPVRVSAKPKKFSPNDPIYTNNYQWHYLNYPNGLPGGANVRDAWSLSAGKGITVAVIDSGITKHPDLDTTLANEGYDFISLAYVSGRDADGRARGGWDTGDWTNAPPWNDPQDGCLDQGDQGSPSVWHGTHVAGTIAALTNNGIGVAGIAYQARLLPVRALGHCGGLSSDLSDAIVWASGGKVDGVPENKYPAQVINLSLGGKGPCNIFSAQAVAIRRAIERGVTVVVAAGNSSQDTSNYTPANCPGVITVAAHGITGKLAYYSNYGDDVTLSAPGGGVYKNDDPSTNEEAIPEGYVWSTANEGETIPAEPTYIGMVGTSQAAPHVAGTVAMMLSAAQAAGLQRPTPAQIKSLLVRSTKRGGLLDANKAVTSTLAEMPRVAGDKKTAN